MLLQLLLLLHERKLQNKKSKLQLSIFEFFQLTITKEGSIYWSEIDLYALNLTSIYIFEPY